MLDAASTGAYVDLRVNGSGQDNPENGAAWDQSRSISAEMLDQAAHREAEAGRRVRPEASASKERGSSVTLNLEAATLTCPRPSRTVTSTTRSCYPTCPPLMPTEPWAVNPLLHRMSRSTVNPVASSAGLRLTFPSRSGREAAPVR